MDELSKEEKLRLTALDRAIEAGSGNDYNPDGKPIINIDKIIEVAKKFEEYLKGTTNG